MSHLTVLPSTHALKQLAELSGPFPIKNRQLLLAAERFGFGERLIGFLRLYPDHQVFHSRDSFLESCAELKATLRGEQQDTRSLVLNLKGAHHGYYPADTTHQTRVKSGWRNLFWTD